MDRRSHWQATASATSMVLSAVLTAGLTCLAAGAMVERDITSHRADAYPQHVSRMAAVSESFQSRWADVLRRQAGLAAPREIALLVEPRGAAAGRERR